MSADAIAPCPVCGHEAALAFEARFAPVHKCSNPACGHLFVARPQATQGVHEHGAENFTAYQKRDQRLVARFLRDGLLRTGSRVLDIGAGLGHISAEIRRQCPRAEVVCAEAAPQSVAHLRAGGFPVVEDLQQLRPDAIGRFDLILLVEVIEHVEDPVRLLKTCHALLADGGAVFLTTPGGELRNGSHATAAYEVPEHIQFFTARSLGQAARAAALAPPGFIEMYEYHAGSDLAPAKWLKDSARMLRNVLQGRHHFVCTIRHDDMVR